MRARMIAGAVMFAALFLAVGASAKPPGSDAASTVALQWNANALAAVRAATTTNQLPPGAASRSLYQTEGLLYMSYVQAAVYDAATKIGHRYVPYHHFSAAAGDASIEAAVIAAAYDTLVAYLGHTGTLDGQYAASIAALPDDANTARGIAVGEAAAADIVALRANDGRNAASPAPNVGAPTIPVQAGVWVWPPAPSLQIDQTPWMAVMQPFMLESTSQFRVPPPNALTSAQYTADFIETAASGSNLAANDTTRRDTAWFWNANVISQFNMTLQDFATQHNMDLLDTVRLFAMGTMVPTDAGMACFDSKYTYRFWRPITAIRNAGIDGNPATAQDTTWSPLTTTPNHPEYPSAHGCVTSALAQVLAHAIGTDQIDATIRGATAASKTGLDAVPRVFPTVQSLLSEIVDARVWIGFHFRSSVIAGENLGTSVANWELQRYFLPTDDQGDAG